ncbi:MAG: hypothetical protein HY049_03655 [Acidobacteria bacterium]|nr:hypothetical protein [Acidobacteriota bacterium]
MMKRMFALALPVALLLATVTFAAQQGGEVHRGEIMGIDTAAKTLTVKIVSNGDKMNHVYTVQDGVTVIRDANLKTITFADLKNGMHVQVDSTRKGGDRIATQITIKTTKGSKKK